MPEISPANPSLVLLASAARTASTASPQFSQSGYKGIRIWLTVTVASGTGGLRVLLRMKNPIDGAMQEINAGGTNVTTTVTRIYDFYPNIGAAAGFVQESLGRQLGQQFDIQVVHADASSYTYSVQAELLL
ncbi:MAG: hypothetical protein NTX13_10965 [Acidobacteria bacterium]|nr:hypothetical protein [Acidobacteriota bacterium]